jgi:hypothetical protein
MAYQLDGQSREISGIMSTGPSPDLVATGAAENVPINDPVLPAIPEGPAIGIRPGTAFGRRASTMSRQQLMKSVLSGQFETVRPDEGSDLFVDVTGTSMPGRFGEVELDVSKLVTGETAFNEMMDAWANDDDVFEQIAEGLFMNGYTTFEEDAEEIYDFEVVRNGMLSAISTASQYAQAGGGDVGMMPTIDALLKATDADKLQAEFDKITATKKSKQYSKATITEYANKAFKDKLHRAPSDSELKGVIGFIHDLETEGGTTFDLTAEIGAQATALDPQRAQGVSFYNTGQTVKNALGLK